MTFLLFPCVLWISACISFLSADSIISVSARLNSTVVLPCQFKHDFSQPPHVICQTAFGTVFERHGEEIYPGEEYKDRVYVPVKGNCSVVLKNVRMSDAGTYTFSMVVTDKEGYKKYDLVQTIELKVDETTMPGKETYEETSPRNDPDDAGMNSANTLIIISSVIVYVLIAPP